MNPNDRKIKRDHLIKESQEESREKAVEKILSNHRTSFQEKDFNYKLVLSPELYPIHYESLDFDFQEFTNFFFKRINGIYEYDQERVLFFDPQGLKTSKPTDYDTPIIPDEWMNISQHIPRHPNSIVIKKDGVILFNHAQVNEGDHPIIDFDFLCKQLNLFIIKIVPEIYKKMNYNDKVKVLEDYGDLSAHQLVCRKSEKIYDFVPDVESPKEYNLRLDNPEVFLGRILTKFQRMFSKIHND